MDINYIMIYASFIIGFILLWRFYNDMNKELWRIRLAHDKLEYEEKQGSIKASSSGHEPLGTGPGP